MMLNRAHGWLWDQDHDRRRYLDYRAGRISIEDYLRGPRQLNLWLTGVLKGLATACWILVVGLVVYWPPQPEPPHWQDLCASTDQLCFELSPGAAVAGRVKGWNIRVEDVGEHNAWVSFDGVPGFTIEPHVFYPIAFQGRAAGASDLHEMRASSAQETVIRVVTGDENDAPSW